MDRFLGMPVDSKAVPQAVLDIANKERSNVFPWNGQFSPQLAEALLKSFAVDARTILDPFVGSGTVVREAARLGKEVFGTEINPAAYSMAQTYRLMGLTNHERRRVLARAEDRLADAISDDMPLFSDGDDQATEDVKMAILNVLHDARDEWDRIVIEVMIILLDFLTVCSADKANRTWKRLRSIILGFEQASRPIHVLNVDARQLSISDGSIDFVLTSPPYINVFNYHQQYRRSAEAIGWNLLEVARAEIGSNRKHRGNRFLTIIQYCLDIGQALQEISRVCRDGARVVAVVGRESNVRKTPFYNGEILANIAVRSLGWSFLLRQRRQFKNRFGDTICEDILHFSTRRSPDKNHQEIQSREIAREVLAEAKNRVPSEVRADLASALSLIAEIRPSELFDATAAFFPAMTTK